MACLFCFPVTITDERKLALVEIYVELVGMLVEVLETPDSDQV